jgi:hypothetical protein
MALNSGSILQSKNDPGTYANSMAKAMEAAFLAEWPHAMGNQPAPEVNDQMRLMFTAIAKGVVNHLINNDSAFVVSTVNGNSNHSHSIDVQGNVPA